MSDIKKRAVHRRLTTDFRYYARRVLKIETKEGGEPTPFILNRSQEFLHKSLEDQIKECGWVRALIVKGRQQGMSTYTGGRFYHKITTQKGKRTFIMSHQSESSSKLFTMVETYYDNTPVPLRPIKDIDNATHYRFTNKSHYRVGTAGNANIGRGGTVQFFHGSEVAYWENTEGLETGILESVAELPGTEIILESTANGMTGFFYEQCVAALEGKGDYILVFIPWYWQEEYTRQPIEGFRLNTEEEVYKGLYELNDGQMYWRRKKIEKFGRGDPEKGKWKFMQEYPAHVMEAFQTSGETLIGARDVMAARKSKVTDIHAPYIIGCDPGRNKDRTVIVHRRGRELLKIETFIFDDKEDVQMIIAGKLVNIIKDIDPDKVFIDVGEGHGTIDRLKELGYGDIVTGVKFGSKALDEDQYVNKRAEMWLLMRDWIEREDGEVSILDTDELQKDLTCVPKAKENSNGRFQLVSKDQIRKDFGMSPDIGDAVALTFAYPVKRDLPGSRGFQKIKNKSGKGSPLSTRRRVNRIMGNHK